MNIALVVSRFNGDITSRMLAVARKKASDMGLGVARVCTVPGAYDMPVVVDALLRRSDIDAVVAIGAIIRGQTKHDEAIAHAAFASLQSIAVRRGKPVALGISGPGMHERHAYARIRPVAEGAVEAAAATAGELERIG